eukprot:CAMPEP_0197663634 /NCGR_PEP_ID=MMETSP1338-20131121/58154_1 /TAXON_ID=43686 ORGANISM="Pelagodinium beii, Strain RCC1491" /NCGR_SAMPLE_ID=MMETSP1338 /ASSEMBLY_ACC=CAM_ASM_000754 /LENGTH=147 /DNA_ID=CAMNT_0043242113 /DNA_START=34 /DNA_END=477 /DNA_ORIENTATION=+
MAGHAKNGDSKKAMRSTFGGVGASLASRNAPAALSNKYNLQRAQLERFDLYSAVDEYRSTLIADHKRNLAGGLVAPKRSEDLRKCPMAALPEPRWERMKRKGRSLSTPPGEWGNFMKVPLDTVHVKTAGSHLCAETCIPLPIHVHYG